MDDKFNTSAGWVLFSGIVALGLASLSSKYFEADKPHPVHHGGYPVEGGEAAGGGKAAVPIETLLASADPAKGEATFKKCTSCHTINAGGANGIGPNLHGIMGKGIGKAAAGFAYSSGMAAKGGSWDFAAMNEWLTSPKKFVEGTKMSFAGLGNAEDRANLMVYLNAQGSNLPLPAAPAAAAAPAEGDAAAAAAAPAKDAAATAAAPAAPAAH